MNILHPGSPNENAAYLLVELIRQREMECSVTRKAQEVDTMIVGAYSDKKYHEHFVIIVSEKGACTFAGYPVREGGLIEREREIPNNVFHLHVDDPDDKQHGIDALINNYRQWVKDGTKFQTV